MPKPKYPHMRQWETIIMDKFHQKITFPANYTYDVHLRIREPIMPYHMSDNERLLWARLTAKRIDVVIETPGHIYVCEVKDRLRPSAVGQALTYLILYREQFKPSKPVEAGIITEYLDPDMLHVCEVYNIKVWKV